MLGRLSPKSASKIAAAGELRRSTRLLLLKGHQKKVAGCIPSDQRHVNNGADLSTQSTPSDNKSTPDPLETLDRK